jgi:hypothetical protein
MAPPYLLITIAYDGRARYSFTSTPTIPEGHAPPGGIAFIIQPIAVDARHGHPASFSEMNRNQP